MSRVAALLGPVLLSIGALAVMFGFTSSADGGASGLATVAGTTVAVGLDTRTCLPGSSVQTGRQHVAQHVVEPDSLPDLPKGGPAGPLIME